VALLQQVRQLALQRGGELGGHGRRARLTAALTVPSRMVSAGVSRFLSGTSVVRSNGLGCHFLPAVPGMSAAGGDPPAISLDGGLVITSYIVCALGVFCTFRLVRNRTGHTGLFNWLHLIGGA
jgi:hypothetical protein